MFRNLNPRQNFCTYFFRHAIDANRYNRSSNLTENTGIIAFLKSKSDRFFKATAADEGCIYLLATTEILLRSSSTPVTSQTDLMLSRYSAFYMLVINFTQETNKRCFPATSSCYSRTDMRCVILYQQIGTVFTSLPAYHQTHQPHTSTSLLTSPD